MKKSYYILGVGHKVSYGGKKRSYEVWMDKDNLKAPFVMLEGQGMGGVGGSFKPGDILETHWKEHLSITGTEWLIPLCQYAVQNMNQLDVMLVLETYSYLHNSSPLEVHT